MSTVGSSLSIFTNWSIIMAITLASRRKVFASIFFVSLATYLSLYPIMLIIPCLMLASKGKTSSLLSILSGMISLLLSSALLLYSSFLLLGNWDFINSYYGCMYVFFIMAVFIFPTFLPM